MKYDIEAKNDLTSGTTLRIQIPESELDRKALLTAEVDTPPFLVPFHHRVIDGNVEIIYEIRAYGKLQYFRGSRDPGQYVRLWNDLLNPLLDCSDWFLTPFSFVLESDYLFFDKTNEKICYLYIPSVNPCSDEEMLKELARGITTDFPVTDPKLENLVLRSIMQDFQPLAFLQMLKEQGPAAQSKRPAERPASRPAAPQMAMHPPVAPPQAAEPAKPQKPPRATVPAAPKAPAATACAAAAPAETRSARTPDNDDVIINLQNMGYGMKNTSIPPQQPAAKGKKKEKKEKEKKEKEKKEKEHSLFGKKKKDVPVDIRLGAAAPVATPANAASMPPARRPEPAMHTPESYPAADRSGYGVQGIDESVTQIEDADSLVTQFRRVGDPALPLRIVVDAPEGGLFTIGRFDTSVNRKQSDFEFDKATKAVSRHHAAVVLKDDEYTIVDLGSKAGTFVNGQKLDPNIPCKLNGGDRVSFGNGGADYIFEK